MEPSRERKKDIAMLLCENIPFFSPLEKDARCTEENPACKHYEKPTGLCLKKKYTGDPLFN